MWMRGHIINVCQKEWYREVNFVSFTLCVKEIFLYSFSYSLFHSTKRFDRMKGETYEKRTKVHEAVL